MKKELKTVQNVNGENRRNSLWDKRSIIGPAPAYANRIKYIVTLIE